LKIQTRRINRWTLANQGMQVHEQYTLHAHFLALSLLLSNAEKVRVYMDQDSGFRAGFMAAFHQRVKERTADGFFVSVLKEASIDQKDAAILKAKNLFKEWQKANPKLSPGEVELEMTLAEMDRMTTIGHWGDRWFIHPTPNMGESDKQICWLVGIDAPIAQTQETNEARYEQRIHFARLYLKGSLHAVDRFFMQARRRLSLAERGVPSASTDRRIWHGYSAYKPQNLGQVLEIFRVFYNYCAVGRDKQTPAMRLGLARGPVKLEDILYFSA